MKPSKIFLIRHAESEGNVDKGIHSKIPDYAIRLSPKGKIQASAAGVDLKRRIGKEKVFFYVSPYFRTRETFMEIARAFDSDQISYREEPRIREQEWAGRLQIEGFNEDIERERDKFGHFYYRFQGGEACSDVYDRVSGFLDTLFRDFEKPEFPDNCVVVSHGMALRVILARWFKMTIEEFELLKNPRNAEIIALNKMANGKYQIFAPLAKWDKPNHTYQFPIQL